MDRKNCRRGDIVWLIKQQLSGQVIEVLIPQQKFKIQTDTKTLVTTYKNLERLF